MTAEKTEWQGKKHDRFTFAALVALFAMVIVGVAIRCEIPNLVRGWFGVSVVLSVFGIIVWQIRTSRCKVHKR
jgi:undecaprenyl pyrophosphate phosphatase UppP